MSDSSSDTEKLYQEALSYKDTDSSLAFDLFSRCADMGHSAALYELGSLYYLGKGVEKDREKAIECWRKSGDLGHPVALYNLGAYYYEHLKVGDTITPIVTYWNLAAKQDYIPAIMALALLYDRGLGTEKEPLQAFFWYRKAANLGNADAQSFIGSAYLEGKGIEKNPQKAVSWLKKAVRQKHKTAIYKLAYAYFSGLGVEQDYDKAIALWTQTANEGFADSQYALSCIYHEGHGVPINLHLATLWSERAAEQNHKQAQLNIAFSYLEGSGVVKNLEKAQYWFKRCLALGEEKARKPLNTIKEKLAKEEEDCKQTCASIFSLLLEQAQKGDSSAQYLVARAYEEGFGGVDCDHNEALSWWNRAAEQEDIQSLIILGDKALYEEPSCEEEGRRYLMQAIQQNSTEAMIELALYLKEKQNFTESLFWLRKAAKKKSPRAVFFVGISYEYGLGVEQSHTTAMKFFHKAAQQGYGPAQFVYGLAFLVSDETHKPNFTKAIYYLELAAEQNEIEAQYELGMVFCSHPKRGAEGIDWLRKAARAGQTNAKFQLGKAYMAGIGVEKDYTLAREWLSKAVAAGHSEAQDELEKLNSLIEKNG